MPGFVEVEHKQLGRTFVRSTRVQHLSEGWAVVEGDKPREAKPPTRITTKANTADTNPEAGPSGSDTHTED